MTVVATSLMTLNNDLFKRAEEMNLLWLERAREYRKIELDFGTKLLTAKNTADAIATCNEWMAKRLVTMASGQQVVATAWFGLISDVIFSTVALSSGQARKSTP